MTWQACSGQTTQPSVRWPICEQRCGGPIMQSALVVASAGMRLRLGAEIHVDVRALTAFGRATADSAARSVVAAITSFRPARSRRRHP